MEAIKPIIDFNECLRDSPYFRKELESQEASVNALELRLEKVVKSCGVMVDSGKSFVSTQSTFANSLWDLSAYFKDDPTVGAHMNKMIHAVQEMNKFLSILLDQASLTIIKNLTAFVKNDIKKIHESHIELEKYSNLLDSALTKNSQAGKSKPVDVEEATNMLNATHSSFQHAALNHAGALTVLHYRKRHEVLSTILSFMHACGTYFHQGSDLSESMDTHFKQLTDDIAVMRRETTLAEKRMEDCHSKMLPVDATPAPGVPMEGYLFKRTSNAFKTWHRRWFLVQDHHLVYRKRTGEENVTVMEELRLCKVRPISDTERRFCFEVQSPSRVHILQADTEELCNAWVKALGQAIGSAIHEVVDEPKGKDISPTEDEGQKKSNIDDSLLRRPPKLKVWEQLLRIPGNELCCDCSNESPRWASINLGITLCIACSGVHRSLGVHYSKVRSLTLDAWEPEVLKVMAELGNEVVNRVYTACVPKGTVRATPQCEQTVRGAWIRAKYEERKFVQKLPGSSSPTGSQSEGRPARSQLPVRRWSVKRERRRPKSKDSRNVRKAETLVEVPDDSVDITTKEPPGRPVTWSVSKSEEVANGANSGVASHLSQGLANISAVSEESLKSLDVLLFGTDIPTPPHDIELLSDQDSTTGGEEDESLEEEDIGKLQPTMLLYKAAAVHNIPVMCRALALRADKDWKNMDDLGRTALHQAVVSGSVMACQYLILNGTSVDTVDDEGYTALHLATLLRHTGQVCLFLKHRANQHIANSQGVDALQTAVNLANPEIVTLLRLALLNEEMRDSEAGAAVDATFIDVVRDISAMADTHPERLVRDTTHSSSDSS